MGKTRLIIFLITIFFVASVGTLVSLYARGYRFDTDTLEVSPNGLLVLKSAPDGAQIYLNGELETATNATLTLAPGTYDVSVKKEGFYEWEKRLTIEEEIVTESTAHLFKTTPSLSAITLTGILNPVPSPDMTKLSYVIPPDSENEENSGLWIMETLNLPFGFAREPHQITDGDLTEASWEWSPDGTEILLTTPRGTFLIDTNRFTPQSERTNIATQIEETRSEWRQEEEAITASQVQKLPDAMQDILERKASAFVFSPDDDMVLYTASGSATIEPNLIPQLPGSSTQHQERSIVDGATYVYDIEEDRNFLIDDAGDPRIIQGGIPSGTIQKRLSWFPTARHIILSEPNHITIMDYDGTNRQTVYEGVYTAPHAYPTLSLDRLIILTNLGANSKTPDLYSLSVK